LKDTISCIRKRITDGLGKKAIENYYYNRGNIGKGVGARWLDRVLVGLSVVAVVYMLALWRLSSYGAALIISFLAAAAYYAVDRGIRWARVQRGRESILKKELMDRFQVLISSKDDKGFYLMFKEILDRTGFFSDLELVLDDQERPIIIEGRLGQNGIGICCRKTEAGRYVEVRPVAEFVEYCKGRGLARGLFITNGYFEHQARKYMAETQDFDIYSADIDTIYRVLLKDSGALPIKDIERDIELKALENYGRSNNRIVKAVSLKKAGVNLALALVLAFYSRYVPFGLYYMFVSIIMLCLSLLTLIRWSICSYREAMDREITLDTVLAGLSKEASR
jgi:hypothetical protein